MNLESLIGVQPKGTEIEINPSRLHVEAVKVNDDDDYVGKIVGRLAVTDQLRIIRFMKTEVAITLQRRILFADLVDPRNKISQAAGRMQIAVFEFIFLGIQVLFAARLKRSVFA